MMCNNSKLDHANMNAYITFDEILQIGSQEIKGENFLEKIKGHNSGTDF